MRVKFKKLDPAAHRPEYASVGAACFDLRALDGEYIHGVHGNPDQRAVTFHTGIAVEVPKGFAMLIYSRSGHGFKHGLRLVNSVGVIDSDYRGEVMVRLINDSEDLYRVERGERIAQAMIVPAYEVEFVEGEELSDTARGAGGIGSTGGV